VIAIIIGIFDVKILISYVPGFRIYHCDFKLCGFAEEGPKGIVLVLMFVYFRLSNIHFCECRHVHGFWWKWWGRWYKGGVSLPILFWVFWYRWIMLPHWRRASNGGKKWGMTTFFYLSTIFMHFWGFLIFSVWLMHQ